MARIGGASPIGQELFMTVRAGMAYRHVFHAADEFCENQLKAKFHCASWFEAGRKQVRSRSATSFEPVCDQLRTSFKADSVMEFGREPASSC